MKDATASATSRHSRLRPTKLPLSDVRFIIDKFEAKPRQCIARKSQMPEELLVRSQYHKPAQSLSDCEVRSRCLVLNARSCDTEVPYVSRGNRGKSVATAVHELGRSNLPYTDQTTNAKGRECCASNGDDSREKNVYFSVPNGMISEKGAACFSLDRRAGISVYAFSDSNSARCKNEKKTDESVNRAKKLSDSDCISGVCLPGYLGAGFPLDVLKSSVGEAAPSSNPGVPIWRLGSVALTACLIAPRMFTYVLLYPFCRLVFGTLYPAYASYKAVRSKNVKEYVKWMMYWIVFALFTCAETFTDVLFSWFPFYYEVKIVLVLWLLSPATKGSSILYRKFVHPALSKREHEIDEYITKATEQGYHTVLNLGSKGVNYATTVIVQTAIKGGGGLVQQLRKSYSLSDLSESDPRLTSEAQAMIDEADDVMCDPRLVRRNIASRSYVTRRSASESNSRAPLYFPEVDVDIGQATRVMAEDFSYVKSSEDISSGYSSADNSAAKEQLLTRAGSIGASRVRTRTPNRTGLTTVRRPQAAEDSEATMEELQGSEPFYNCDDYPTLIPSSPSPFPYPYHLSQTEPPFLFEIVDNKIKIVQLLDIVRNTNLVNTPKIADENEQRVDGNIVLKEVQKENIVEKPVQVSNSGIEPEFISNPEVVTNLEATLSEDKEIAKDEYLITNNNNCIPKDNETKDSNSENKMHLNETNKNDNFNVIPIADLTKSQNDLIECNEHETETKILDTTSLNAGVCGKDEVNEKGAMSNSNNSLLCTQPLMNSGKVFNVMSQDLQKSESNFSDLLLLKTEMSTKDEIKKKNTLSYSSSNASLNSTRLLTESSKDMVNAISDADTSSINNNSEDSEDGAFVTPGSSPKMVRKKTKAGKYGKRLAPLPPTSNNKDEKENNYSNMENAKFSGVSNEANSKEIKRISPIKATLVLKPGIVKEIGPRESSSGKPAEIFISETNKRKRRIKMKNKSPNCNKHESPITKLKQLPGRLAFWHKADKSKLDTDSDSSDGYSMRSSDYEDTHDTKDVENTNECKTFDCSINIPNVVINDVKDTKETVISCKDYEDTGEIEAGLSETLIVGNLSQPKDNQVLNDAKNIIEKSDALQKLIEAKLVDHPEYKFTYIPLHGTYNEASKSTDV